MKVPFSGWSLVDIWDSIFSDPKIVTHNRDRRQYRGHPYALDLQNGWYILLDASGPIDTGIYAASLWNTEFVEPIAMLDETTASWTKFAPGFAQAINEICWPYAFIVDNGIWCITDQSTTKVFLPNYNYSSLPDMGGDIEKGLQGFNAMIDEYVANLKEDEIEESNLCSQCELKLTRHLVEHVVRGECNEYLLSTLIGTTQLTSAQRELLAYTLRHVIGSTALASLTFALPPKVSAYMRRNLMWPAHPLDD